MEAFCNLSHLSIFTRKITPFKNNLLKRLCMYSYKSAENLVSQEAEGRQLAWSATENYRQAMAKKRVTENLRNATWATGTGRVPRTHQALHRGRLVNIAIITEGLLLQKKVFQVPSRHKPTFEMQAIMIWGFLAVCIFITISHSNSCRGEIA